MTSLRDTSPFTATEPGARQRAYADLRRAGPVRPVLTPGGPAWIVTGHDEVRRALTDPRLVSPGPDQGPFAPDLPADVRSAMNTHLLHRSPPDHTRLRRLVSAAFTRRRVERMGPRIEEIADGLLDQLEREPGPVDLVDGFAYPLPMTVICELLGVPEDGRAVFRGWSATIVAGTLAGLEAYAEASAAMIAYIRGLLGTKRRAPSDDLLSALVAVRDDGDRLTEDELTSMVFLLLVAGHETTVNLIANGAHTLLTHPVQLARLVAEPALLSTAVEELLRVESPLQVTIPRIATEPLELGGVSLPAGATVFPSVLAANRDPDRVADPDTVDVNRTDQAHLAFGHGIHHCLGAPLARLEGRLALGVLLARFPGIRLAVPPEAVRWRPGVLMHGLEALPVVLDRAAHHDPRPGGTP